MQRNRFFSSPGRVLFLLAVLLIMTSCAPMPAAADVVGEILAEAPVPFPAGTAESRLSDGTLTTLFGETALSEEMKTVEDYCIYMASRSGPAEVAVLRCYAASDSRTVSRMLLRRADLLKPHLPDGTSAKVAILGRYVILAVCTDPDAVITAAKRAIRGL